MQKVSLRSLGCKPPQSEEAFQIQAQFFVVALEVLLDQVRRKVVVPRRHGGMGGEDVACAGHLHRLAEAEAVAPHQLPDAFQGEKGGMPLVQVADLGGDAQRHQGAHPADAQHDFLAQPHFVVPAVEPGGDFPLVEAVFRQVGVQKVKLDPSDVRAP